MRCVRACMGFCKDELTALGVEDRDEGRFVVDMCH